MKKLLEVFAVLSICMFLVQCKKDDLVEPENEVTMIIHKINLLRQSGCNCGTEFMPVVPKLSSNSQLQKAAITHANDMAQRNYFDHLSPEGSTPSERASNAGYDGNFRAENLARGYALAEQVVKAWKNSNSHCKAMMDAKSNEAGVGMAQNYWVVTFGDPL